LFYQFALGHDCDLYDHPTLGCHAAYWICLFCYACIVVPMSCMDMAEQAIVQVCMTIYRFSAFFIIILTVVIAMFFDNPHDGTDGDEFVDWSGFAIVFTSGAVALNFHYNIPDLINPLQNKRYSSRIVNAAQGTAFGFYILVGLMCSVYFGKDTKPLVTLNWKDYTGREGGWGGSDHDRPFYAIIVQLFVMLFPVFDMLSVFPLVAITLGNNLLETTPPKYRERGTPKTGKLISRLTAAVPPIILAAAMGALDTIFSFTGLFAFLLGLIFPALLQLYSVRYCWKVWGKGSEVTPFSSLISALGFVYIALRFGITALLFAILNFIAPSLFG